MHRRSSVLTLTAAAALLAATPLITACGAQGHPGAAAVVGGDTISMSQLQARVAAVRDAQRDAPQGEQLVRRTGRLDRATLDGMIRHDVVARVADQTGVHVTRSEVEQARRAYEQQAGGAKALQSALLQQQALAPSQIDDRVWLELSVQKIAKASGIDLRTAQGSRQLTKKFAEASREMDIQVNPRYGRWDSAKAGLAGAKTPWLNDVSGRSADRGA
jgi:SurA-like protein